MTASLLDALAAIVGADYVIGEEDRRVFFSTDIAARGVTADLVVRPGSASEIAAIIRHCRAHGLQVIPRGGGMSFTGGYRPDREGTVMLDLRRLDRIVEINETDMQVTVESGCTWKTLYDALKAKGLRTPYFGPMSGYSATVGGALSQGSFFFGSTQHGAVAESVLALEVVLGDGRVIRTGTLGTMGHGVPFYRWFGPDLTGLFLSDTGALGIKTTVCLRLIPFPRHQRHASFALAEPEVALDLLSAIARSGLAAEAYCWDPMFMAQLASFTGLKQGITYLAGVVGNGKSLWSGLRSAARVAAKGRSIFDGDTYLVHVAIDDVTAAGADARLEAVRSLARHGGAGEIDAAVPMTTRGTPFIDFNGLGTASAGRRNLPTNALCPPSHAPALLADIRAFFAENAAIMAAYRIDWGLILFAVGTTAICIEPLILWSDPQHLLHDRQAERSDLAGLAGFRQRDPAEATASDLRRRLIALFSRHGSAHVQIGRAYPWLETREPDTRVLHEQIKALLDPDGMVNMGSLGFGRSDIRDA